MLNAAQQHAVGVEGHCLITACPGSGKTTVLQQRAAHLLRTVPGSVICGVTFTSEAAAELEHRIRHEAANAGTRLKCGTFHSLCRRQLQQSGLRFKLVNDRQRLDLLRRAWRDRMDDPSDSTFEQVLTFVDEVKSSVDPMLPPAAIDGRVAVYERYQELLRQLGAMDFADLLVDAVKGMQRGTVRPYAVTHMLVNEFQDTDGVQLAWVREHVEAGVNVTVVGDDDQAIYGWRNALGYKGMEEFRTTSDATHISLDVTYRCAQEIIVPCARLIAFNEERIPKVLTTASRERGEVRTVGYPSRDEEMEAVAYAIARSGEPGDWGVLARTNAQLESLEELIAGRIPVIRSGGTSFWDTRGPSLFLGACHSIAFGEMLGLDEIMRRSGVSEERLRTIHQRCGSESGGLQRFLSGTSAGGVKDPVGRLQAGVRSWKQLLDRGEMYLALNGIAHYMKSHVKLYQGNRKEEDRLRDHARLDSCAKAVSRLRGTLAQRLQVLQRKDVDDETQSARLMTLHAAKGLEFNKVWILGCEEGSLPSKAAPVDEERRLIYVGMTRARLGLTLSYVISDKNPASRFLGEAGLI